MIELGTGPILNKGVPALTIVVCVAHFGALSLSSVPDTEQALRKSLMTDQLC